MSMIGTDPDDVAFSTSTLDNASTKADAVTAALVAASAHCTGALSLAAQRAERSAEDLGNLATASSQLIATTHELMVLVSSGDYSQSEFDDLVAQRDRQQAELRLLHLALGNQSVDVDGVRTAYDTILDEVNEGDDLGMSEGELNRVKEELEALSPAELEIVVGLLGAQEWNRIFHNVHSTGFWSNDWNDRERTDFYELLAPLSIAGKATLGRHDEYMEAWAEAEDATDKDAGASAALQSLLSNEDDRSEFGFDERTAILWQGANYPAAVAIDNLERAAGREWYRDLDLEDTQRTAKTIGYLSTYQGGDRVVIDNTLDRLLDEDSSYNVNWKTYDNPAGTTTYGSASGEQLNLNEDFIDADNDPMDATNRQTVHLVTHTVAHEVSHLVNGDQVDDSFEYFMGEYRAYYVGFLAENGHPPTNDEAARRVNTRITATRGAHERITTAVADPVEGPLFGDFGEDLLGRPVTGADLAAEIAAGATDGGDPAPAPISVNGGPNNVDNS